jgi:WD40 repeat protein
LPVSIGLTALGGTNEEQQGGGVDIHTPRTTESSTDLAATAVRHPHIRFNDDDPSAPSSPTEEKKGSSPEDMSLRQTVEALKNPHSYCRELRGHAESILSVVFSADGRRIASGSNDGTVRMWDATTGQSSHVLEGHAGGAKRVMFAENGILYAVGEETIKVWEPVTGKPMRTMNKRVDLLAFSVDGKVMATIVGRCLTLFESFSATELHSVNAQAQVRWLFCSFSFSVSECAVFQFQICTVAVITVIDTVSLSLSLSFSGYQYYIRPSELTVAGTRS